MNNRINFAVTVFDRNTFDLDYFCTFIKDIYRLDMYYNPWYFDFYLDKTYYIHLIDVSQKVFFVVPFKLSSNLNKNSGLVLDCFNILEKELDKFLDSNLYYNDNIIIYVCKDVVKMIDEYILRKEMENYLKDFDKFCKDVSFLYDSNIDVLPNIDTLLNKDENNFYSIEGNVINRLDFGCTIFDLNEDLSLNLVNDPNYDNIFNDEVTFSNWIEFLFNNKILYNFRLNKTYYIHLTGFFDGKIEAFSIIPFRLISLEDVNNSDCFNLLKMYAKNYSKKQIFVYIGKENSSEGIDYNDIVDRHAIALEKYNKLIN